jgi:CRP-like cAMP-binding protein
LRLSMNSRRAFTSMTTIQPTCEVQPRGTPDGGLSHENCSHGLTNPGAPMLRQWRQRMSVKNCVLKSFSPLDFNYIRPLLQPVTLKRRAVLQEPNRGIEYINFVETGIISLMTVATGSILETAMVSSRGFAPASAVLGARTSAHRSIVLVSGHALQIRSDDLTRLMMERPQIRETLLQYVQSLMVHGSQRALCGVRHQLDQRLACWLCLACDALDDDVLPVTHDHLSTILGFRRAGVTQTLNLFEEQGLVGKMRGVLQILDRHRLEQRACCCYRRIATAYGRTSSPDHAAASLPQSMQR